MLRRLIERAIQDVQAGEDAPHIIRSPEANAFPDLIARNDVLPASTDWRNYWKQDLASND